MQNALIKGDKQEIATILRQYKNKDGSANYPALFNVPITERLPNMAAHFYNDTLALITGAITMAFESINMKRGLSGGQIVDLAEAVIETSHEDNLALEDIILFLQQLVYGRYDMTYESFDIPKFMKLFEQYRQNRHEAIAELRENESLEFKGLGDPTRVTKPETVFEEHLQQYSQKLQSKNDEIKLLRRESKDRIK